METVGVVALVLAGTIVLFALIMVLMSIPDMRRYLKIRAM